mgnify:CR=1 FL=1
MPIKANAIITARVRGINDLTVLNVLISLYNVTELNRIITPVHTMKGKLFQLSEQFNTNL